MIDIHVELVKPFGPSVLVSKCPKKILEKLNNYVDDVENDLNLKRLFSSKYKNVPNLLERDFENIYLTENVCNEIGLTNLVETLGNYYVENSYFSGDFDLNERVKLSIISGDDEFPYENEQIYSDCWINRYYKGDYTPLHKHGSDLAGIIFLKIPEEIKNLNSTYRNNIQEHKMHGKLEFVYGQYATFCPNTWTPHQEDGIIMIFPNWLNHLVYAQKTDEERRTLSFNLITETSYNKIKKEFLGD